MNDLIPKKYRADEEIIRLTIEQIKKDFGTHLPEFIFSGNKDRVFDELTFQVSEVLKTILAANSILFRSLLYRIDVRESDIVNSSNPNFFQALAEKIIQREFQKVLTKRFFSHNRQ